jgi:hypothetical protein
LQGHFAVNGKPFSAMLDEAANLPCAKRAAAAKQKYPFQDTRLSRTVWAKNVTALRVETEVDLSQAAQRGDADSAQRQERYPL